MFPEALEAEKKKESQEDSVETYEEAFVRIKAMTGEDDIDVLVNRFIEVEDTNFALFNYVNEQNNEIEKLNEEIFAVSKLSFVFVCIFKYIFVNNELNQCLRCKIIQNEIRTY